VPPSFQLLAQHDGLRIGLPGVRHFFHRGGIVALHFFQAEIDAGGDHKAIIGDRSLGGRDRLGGRVDGGDFSLHDLDAVIGGKLVVLDGQRIEVGKDAADVQIAERARDEMVIALDHDDFNALVHHANVLGSDGAAVAAADHDDTFGRFRHQFGCLSDQWQAHCTRRTGAGADQLEETSAIQSHVVFSLI
jgi:hypothetical protein